MPRVPGRAGSSTRRRTVRADLVYLVAGVSLLLAIVLPGPAGPVGGLGPDGARRRRHRPRLHPAAGRDAARPPGQPRRDRARHRARGPGRPDGSGARDRPSARAAQPGVVGGVEVDLAAARHHDAAVHRCRGSARVGRGRRAGGSAPARRGPRPDRPGPGLRRPGRRTADRRPRGRRVRRAPIRPHLGGRSQRRARLPLRVRRDPAGHSRAPCSTGLWSGSATT